MFVKETLDAKVVEEGHARHLNQYIIQKELGSGSFGVVHLGLDTEMDRKVAIKEFSKTKLRKQQALKSGQFFGRGRGRGRGAPPVRSEPENPLDLVKGEIAILKKLNHPNVVKLYEVLDDPSQDSLFMVFELCEKGTILSIDTPNPDNALLSKDNLLKIVDFGVSEMFSTGKDKSDKTAGTPTFYPPEMAGISQGEFPAQAGDIWSMGVTLFCLVFGKLPFTGISVMDLYENIRTKNFEVPENTDPLLVDLLKKILDKNPDTRITIDQLRQHPWVTDQGRSLLPSKEKNCVDLVTEITEQDVNAAIKKVNPIFTVLKAASKLKKGIK